MGKTLRIYVIAAISAFIVVACSSSGCLDNGSSIPLAGFYSSTSGSQISLNNLEIKGVDAPNDSTLLISGTEATEVYLPMRSDRSSTKWALIYHDEAISQYEITDTISFNYESIPYFASEECGAMYSYSIDRLEYTTNIIDSVALINRLITNADIESIKIYFRTATAEEGDEQ